MIKMSESTEQQALFEWAAIEKRKYPELEMLHAIPNSGKRPIKTAVRMKAEGQKSGVSDMFLPVARNGRHGLYIELKIRGGRLTDNQAKWIEMVMEQGYSAEICFGWEEAREILLKYLRG
jgi:hypothetical protein